MSHTERSTLPKRVLPLLIAASLAACAGSTEPKAAPAPPLLTELPRSLSPNEIRASQAANQFAFSLFRRINAAQGDANVFVSPLSVSFALGMTMNGANGSTLDEMRSTLGFGAAELSDINDGYRNLMSLEQGLDATTTFEIANSVWYRSSFPVLQSFKDTVARVFNAEVNAADFSPATVDAMNAWVSAKTHGKIPTIIESIGPELVMCLINAIYFKGSWREQFDPAQTVDAPFEATGGPQTVRMMHRSTSVRVGHTPQATIGELTYGNGAFVMTIALPAPGVSIDAFAAGLDTASWSALVRRLSDYDKSEVYLPKLRLEYARKLNDDLKGLGMNTPFGDADFTRMSPRGRELFIDFVQHKTFVDVNEEGTEAAAATNVGISLISGSTIPTFRVDRPFIFAIRERFSGTILFIGKIAQIP
jgi:serine protease inhibitor